MGVGGSVVTRAAAGATRLRMAVQRRLPLALGERLDERFFGYTASDRPDPSRVPDTAHRVYIGPANFAEQGYAWARALERAVPDLAAVSMAPVRGGQGYSFRVDLPVPYPVYAASRRWQLGQRAAVDEFSHVVAEAGRPLFPRLDGGDAFAEARRLRSKGLGVAIMFHGSEIRSPERHAASSPWSPYRDETWADVPRLAQLAAANLRGARELGAPVLVSTCGLLLDVPEARWCPVVVEPTEWRTDAPVLERARPVVVHAPSHGVIKGTALVEPVLHALHGEGLIEYRPVSGVPHSAMAAVYADADVVLDQFRLGDYGVAACEAMAAGRVVVGHVDQQVRAGARAAAGVDLPIVEATSDTLEAVLRQVVGEREPYRALASAGRRFVESFHDGTRSAQVLTDALDIP